MQAWEEERPFQEIVQNAEPTTEVLAAEDIDDAFDPSYHIRNVDRIFDRVGLG